jgi:large subunit ribosomal protein L25
MKLAAETRTVFGKKVAQLRRDGFVPAEVYGHGKKNEHVSVPQRELARALHEVGHTGIIVLGIDGKDTKVLAHEWTRTAAGDIEHVDFYAVKAGEKINAEIPLVFEGEAPAVKEKVGILVKNLHEIEVEALPEKLPHDFVIDISGLTELHAAIHASDIKMPAGVTLETAPDTVIVSIGEIAEEEVEQETGVDQVVVEGEEKRAEEAKKEQS